MQFHQLFARVPVRAVSALLQLLFPADCHTATNPGCVAHGAVHHASATDVHPLGERHQGDNRGYRKYYVYSKLPPDKYSRNPDFQKRHRADNEINHRLIERLDSGSWHTVRWSELTVGDIIKVGINTFFPADLILLSSRCVPKLTPISTR